MTIDIQPILYRYDLDKPPDNWDKGFLNFEYDTAEYGHKNKAQLFFFTNSKEIAIDLGTCATKKYNRDFFYLTETTTIGKVHLIDFHERHNIYLMISLLNDLNINVLTDDFKTYELQNTFNELKIIFDQAEAEKDSIKKVKHIYKLKAHSNSHYEDISLFGQRLTDFDNGINFKKIVNTANPNIEGYRWKEFNDDRGFTYCLFDSTKLGKKTTNKIDLTSYR
ncbi:MAG: hypothetical protein HYX39_11550 [Bacteroidetes bacterium]|nr:hypothetical protein [Bacteroidota bacterium]